VTTLDRARDELLNKKPPAGISGDALSASIQPQQEVGPPSAPSASLPNAGAVKADGTGSSNRLDHPDRARAGAGHRWDPAGRAALGRHIKALHDEGLGASAIAARPNREGGATLTECGQWRHKAVQALINEADVS
jgi:hypothetical protein